MEEKRFYTSADGIVKIITNIALIISLFLLYNIVHNGANKSTISSALFIPIVLIAWYIHPQYYGLNDDGLKIKRPAGSLVIPYKNISYVGYLSKEDLGHYIRLFASGGLFGYFGLYTSRSTGRFSMWCTNKKNLVVIKDNNDQVTVISPTDANSFIEMMTSHLQSAV